MTGMRPVVRPWRLFALLLVLPLGLPLVACSDKFHEYPIIPGGGPGPGINGGVDAARDGNGDAGNMIAGLVCRLVDARDFTMCAATGSGGITVTLDGNVATTASDGSFAIAAPISTNPVWVVDGTTIVASEMSFSAVSVIPAIDDISFGDLMSSNGVLPVTGQGSIFARVVQSGLAVAGVTAVSTPVSTYPAFYDAASATVWGQSATGAHGAVWIPGVAAGSATVSLTPSGGSSVVFGGIPVADGALTFVTVALP
jgi:hypothetical protein